MGRKTKGSMVGTIKLHETCRHGRSLLAGFGVVAMTLGCAAAEGPSSIDIVSETSKTVVETPSVVAAKTTSLDSELDFTTEGKPTKTIETPWGPREVYDIKKDPNVKRALELAYAPGNITFGDVTQGNNLNITEFNSPKYPETRYLRQAHTASLYDQKRLGCRHVKRLPCSNQPIGYFETPTSLENLGQPSLSLNEIKLLKGATALGRMGVHWITQENMHKGRWDKLYSEARLVKIDGKTQTVVGATGIGECTPADQLSRDGQYLLESDKYFIGKDSNFTFNETLDIITTLSCSKWSPE